MRLQNYLFCMTVRTAGLIMGYSGTVTCGIYLTYLGVSFFYYVGEASFTENLDTYGKFLLIWVTKQCLIGIFKCFQLLCCKS